jgi:hypothetical protein
VRAERGIVIKRFLQRIWRAFRPKPKLGTFDKWIFPVIANMADGPSIDALIAVQPMSGPPSGTPLFTMKESKPPIPEFWERFIDPKAKFPSHKGYFKTDKGTESYVYGDSINAVLAVPSQRAVVDAAMECLRYHRDDWVEDDEHLLKVKAGYEKFASTIQPGDTVAHFRLGGIMSMRDGLVVLRRINEELVIVGFHLCYLS